MHVDGSKYHFDCKVKGKQYQYPNNTKRIWSTGISKLQRLRKTKTPSERENANTYLDHVSRVGRLQESKMSRKLWERCVMR
eukprot:scaffold39482_cov37-Cyclotella_meneghiniana.AAC.2